MYETYRSFGRLLLLGLALCCNPDLARLRPRYFVTAWLIDPSKHGSLARSMLPARSLLTTPPRLLATPPSTLHARPWPCHLIYRHDGLAHITRS